jgi:hypothetical protein
LGQRGVPIGQRVFFVLIIAYMLIKAAAVWERSAS